MAVKRWPLLIILRVDENTQTGTEVRSGTSEWLAPAGSRVPPLHLDCSPSSLAERLREGLLRAGAGFEKEKSAEAPAGCAQAEADLAEKLRRSLQTFNEKSAADWMAEEEDDEDSIMTLNTDTTNTEDFDDFSDLQTDLDTWLAK